MAISKAFGGGQFFMEFMGESAGYIKKFEMGKLSGDEQKHNLAGDGVIKKQIVKMTHGVVKLEIGIGMSGSLNDWINSAFNNKHEVRDFAIMICDHDYNVVRRVDYFDCLITEVGIPALDASKGSEFYFTVSIQPGDVIHKKDSGKAAVKIAAKQKLQQNTNFRLLSPIGDTTALMKIDAMKWTAKTTPVSFGERLIDEHIYTSREIGDLKLTLASHVYDKWYEAADKWLRQGQRAEGLETAKTLQVLCPEGKKVTCEIQYNNCGIKEFTHAALEANAQKVSTFDITFYVETMKLIIKEHDKG
jgi:hypothetical protein